MQTFDRGAVVRGVLDADGYSVFLGFRDWRNGRCWRHHDNRRFERGW
jgi:hypothetical protein